MKIAIDWMSEGDILVVVFIDSDRKLRTIRVDVQSEAFNNNNNNINSNNIPNLGHLVAAKQFLGKELVVVCCGGAVLLLSLGNNNNNNSEVLWCDVSLSQQ